MGLNDRSGFQLKYQSQVDELVESRPEVWEGTVEVVHADDRAYVLVGVTHWHSAAIARVETMVRALRPPTIGLELAPGLIQPYSELVAREEVECEMTAAIEASDNDTVIVGMDCPSSEFDEVYDGADDSLTMDEQGQVEAQLARMRSEVEDFIDGDYDRVVPEYAAQTRGEKLEVQVADEKILVRKAEIALKSLEHNRKAFDGLREAAWMQRLRKKQEGEMTMVVCGMKHVESLAKQLR